MNVWFVSICKTALKGTALYILPSGIPLNFVLHFWFVCSVVLYRLVMLIILFPLFYILKSCCLTRCNSLCSLSNLFHEQIYSFEINWDFFLITNLLFYATWCFGLPNVPSHVLPFSLIFPSTNLPSDFAPSYIFLFASLLKWWTFLPLDMHTIVL